MHENKLSKSPKYAPIKLPHTYLLLVLEQNRIKTNKQNDTKHVKHNLHLPTIVSGVSNAHDKLKIIIPTEFSHLYP